MKKKKTYEFNNMIHSKEEIDTFFKYVHDEKASDDNLYYIGLAARNKYLSSEERLRLNFNNTHMLSMDTVRVVEIKYNSNARFGTFKKSTLYRKLLRWCVPSDSWISKNGLALPMDSLVCYMGINPIDISKVATDLKIEMVKADALNQIGVKTSALRFYMNIPRRFMSNCITSRKNRNLIDIDVDTDPKHIDFEDTICDLLNYWKRTLPFEVRDNMRIIYTRGGFHILARNKTFSRDYNANTIRSDIRAFFVDAKEVEINRNGHVPIPGTLQANYKVTMERIC